MPKDAEPFYQLGLAALALQDTVSASEFFGQALAFDPARADVRLKLAELMVTSRHRDAAVKAREMAEELLAASPDNLKALNIVALAELRDGDAAAAAARLEEALKRSPSDAESSLNLARARMVQKNPQEAERILRDAIAKSPKDARALFALADFYLLNGNDKGALEQYTRGLSIEPEHAPALAALGRLQARLGMHDDASATFARLAAHPEGRHRYVHAVYLFESGKRDTAIAEFKRIHDARPTDREARTYLISAYQANHQSEEATRLLTEALKKNSKDADALLHRSRIYLASGNPAAAERDVQLVFQSHSDSAEGHYLQSRIYQARGSSGLQQQELQETLRVQPGHLAARAELSQLLLARKDARGALDILTAAPKEQQGHPAIEVQRIWALIGSDKLAEARTGLDELMKITAADPELLLQDAVLRARNSDFTGAKNALETVLAKRPSDLRALELILQIGAAGKQLPDAAARVRRHIAQYPDLGPVQLFGAQLEQQAGQLPQARAAFELAKKDPALKHAAELGLADIDSAENKLEDARRRLNALLDSVREPEARARLGALEERSGNYDAAAGHYRRVLEADRSNVAVLNNLAYALTEGLGKPDEALPYAERAKELAPYSPAVDDTLGWTYLKKGLHANAVRHLESAVKREPTARRNAHLAMAYAGLGDREKAKRTLEAALRMDPKLPEAPAVASAIAASGDGGALRR